MNIDDDDFTLFALPERFAVDLAQLDRRWRELQAEVHPDRFAAQGTAAQRIAMEWSVRVNQAYQRLKDPLKRAAYLCERRAAPVNAERNTAMPRQFLVTGEAVARGHHYPEQATDVNFSPVGQIVG